MSTADIQYVADDSGDVTAVLVPIAVWKELLAEIETHHLLKDEAMKRRLLEARGRRDGVDFGEALIRLGIE